MNILLDTHVALWALTDDSRLSSLARQFIMYPENLIFVSTASVWEIAIKHAIHREDMPISGREALEYFKEAGYRVVPIEPEHAAAVEELPEIHNDPFDRLLAAQARCEPYRLLTHDEILAKYGDYVTRV